MSKGEIVLINEGRDGNMARYANFGNILFASEERVEKLLKDFGLIEEDATIIITETRGQQITGYGRAMYVEWIQSETPR